MRNYSFGTRYSADTQTAFPVHAIGSVVEEVHLGVFRRREPRLAKLTKPETVVPAAPMTQPVIARRHGISSVNKTEEQHRYLPETVRNERVTVGGKSGRPSRRPTPRSFARQAHAS